MDTKQKHFFIQEHLQKNVYHGGVGNIDIERVLLTAGYQAIAFPFHFDFSLKAKLFRYLYLIKLVFSLPAGAIIFFQFPLYARMHRLLLRLVRQRKSIQIICLVADINGLKDGDAKVLQDEVEILSHFKYFILHGKPMQEWFTSKIPDAKISLLYFFDFLATPFEGERHKSNEIVFAGNLEKSPFLESLHDVTSIHTALRFNIYGPGVTNAISSQPGVIFKGVYPPQQLPGMVEGAFGLLWDGESYEGAGGSIGDYMQYISHHKLSLYILAGLPLIIYENAGAAELVKTLNIGIAVKSIADIEENIQRISEVEYQLMRSRMKPIAEKISKGEYLLSAIYAVKAQMDTHQGTRKAAAG